MALRLFKQRETYGASNPAISAEMDRAFSNCVSGNLSVANLQLLGLETKVPVIHHLSVANAQLQCAVGGYLSGNGIQIETSSNLLTWQTVNTLPVSTNEPVFSMPASSSATPWFFRIQSD